MLAGLNLGKHALAVQASTDREYSGRARLQPRRRELLSRLQNLAGRPPYGCWLLGTSTPPSIFGIPKCPPRWERSSGLMEPETATRLTSVARATRIAMLLTALFSKRIQTSVMPWPPSFSWLLTNCFQPAAWYSSFTELKASGSYIQGSGKWKLWTETPLTPAITRRRSSLSGSSLDAKTSMEWSSVNSVFEDAPCRRASIPCGIQSCCCACVNLAAEITITSTKAMRESLKSLISAPQ